MKYHKATPNSGTKESETNQNLSAHSSSCQVMVWFKGDKVIPWCDCFMVCMFLSDPKPSHIPQSSTYSEFGTTVVTL